MLGHRMDANASDAEAEGTAQSAKGENRQQRALI